MNINFNTNLIDSNKLKERYNLTNLKQQYNLVKIILEENSIQNFFQKYIEHELLKTKGKNGKEKKKKTGQSN